ncbi:hypothetical protein AAG570_007151 [Ranatra chinensis]|uniref:CCHC-type domain-containing protein n=1 Tax=Ranatra chinensis TaxID=642074 RepID=A0ABD0XXR3_9HEMI
MEIGRRAQKEKEHLERFEQPPPIGKDTLEIDLAYRGRRKELKVSAINVACRTEEHTNARAERQPYSVHSDKDNGGQIASGKNRSSEERPHSFQRQEETKGVKRTLCWNCRKIGHPYRQCPALNLPFCTRCGNPRAVKGLCQKCCENTQQGNGRKRLKISGHVSPPNCRPHTSQQEWKNWLQIVKARMTSDRVCGIFSHKGKNDPRPYLKVNILGHTFQGLLDSGATKTIIGQHAWETLNRFGLKAYDSGHRTISVADGRSCEILGCVDLPIELTPIILGLDFWREMAIIPDLMRDSWEFHGEEEQAASVGSIGLDDHLTDEEAQQLDSVVKTFFFGQEERLGCTSLVEHKINTGDATPIKQRYYPVSPVVAKRIEEELDKMLAAGIKAYCRNRKAYDLRRREETLSVGDTVWKRTYAQSDATRHFSAKLAPRYQQARVARVISPRIYDLEDIEGSPLGRWHIKDLKLTQKGAGVEIQGNAPLEEGGQCNDPGKGIIQKKKKKQ